MEVEEVLNGSVCESVGSSDPEKWGLNKDPESLSISLPSHSTDENNDNDTCNESMSPPTTQYLQAAHDSSSTSSLSSHPHQRISLKAANLQVATENVKPGAKPTKNSQQLSKYISALPFCKI